MKNWNAKEQHITRGILRIAGIAALGIGFTFAAPRTTHAQVVTPPVPDNIKVPATAEAFLIGRGVGTQNYVCAPSRSIGHVAFTLFTPQATLFDDHGGQLTTHFFSPNPFENGVVRATWESSVDTSTVWARAAASSVDPAFVTPGAIPWVLLPVVGAQAGPTGGNTLSGTTFIQRVNTVGGAAPDTGCNLPTDIGTKVFVPYTADYIFYKN